MTDLLHGFQPVAGDWPWPVYRLGEGPPVIVIHELFGLRPEVIAFGRSLAGEGFSVWLPVLAGPAPSRTCLDKARAVAGICVSREIHTFRTGATSPVVDRLRKLARHAVAETGARGAGVVGMCFSGGFALAMAVDEAVLAGVAAQPSLPFRTRLTPWCGRDLGMSAGDVDALRERLARGDTEVYVTRFSEDRTSPAERLETLEARLGTTGVVVDPIDSSEGNRHGFDRKDHSVLTYAPTQYPAGPAADRLKETADAVVAFLHRRLA